MVYKHAQGLEKTARLPGMGMIETWDGMYLKRY